MNEMVSRERQKYSYEAKVMTFFSFTPSRAAIYSGILITLEPSRELKMGSRSLGILKNRVNYSAQLIVGNDSRFKLSEIISRN